ncbi:MAG: dienelactone hydrolase family protein [Chitinophagaceae bacterium]|nr:dienelactone hydrolase family protein [Chitinophagaceae bacterium]
MNKYLYPLLLVCLCLALNGFYAPTAGAQQLWSEQKPWEGVPEYYQKWKYPDFQFPSTLGAWTKDRVKVGETLQHLLGDRPERPKQLKVKTLYKKNMNGYTLEKFLIDNEVDGWIPGYIAIPANVKGKVPAVLAMHEHGGSKESVFGFNINARDDASAMLLSRGYAVIAIDSYFNGERRGTGPAGDREKQSGGDQELSQFKINLWFGRSLWGMQLRDEQIALDYLATRPEIDMERLGAQGMSMGSTRAWWLAAIDNRIKAVVGVVCFTRYEELIQQRQLEAHGIYYFVPGMLQHFDTEAVMGMIAPRPFLALTGDSDEGSPISGIRTLEKKLDIVYSLYNKKEQFKSIVYPQTGHVYSDDMKIEMVSWFDKYLK